MQRSPAGSMKCERDVVLIDAVRRHPELYDPRDKRYRDTTIKTAMWEEIARDAGFPNAGSANTRWRSIKDYYLRLVRGYGAGGRVLASAVKYTYAQEMHFLLGTLDTTAAMNRGRPKIAVSPQTACSSSSAEHHHYRMNGDEEAEDDDDDPSSLGAFEHLKQPETIVYYHHRQQLQQGVLSSDLVKLLDPAAEEEELVGERGKHQNVDGMTQRNNNNGNVSANLVDFLRNIDPSSCSAALLPTTSSSNSTTPPISADVVHPSDTFSLLMAKTRRKRHRLAEEEEEEDDEELFGRRVAKFLRRLSFARRKRQACIGIERLMMEFEEAEEKETEERWQRRGETTAYRSE